MKSFSVIILLILTTSCKKEYDANSCQNLIFKQSKGLNAAAGTKANDFKKFCKGKKVKITLEQCKSATNYALTSFSQVTEKKLKAKYGEEVLNCLNKGMIKKYIKN